MKDFFHEEYEVSFSRLPSNLIQLFLERHKIDETYTEDVNRLWLTRQKEYYELTSDVNTEDFFIKAIGRGFALPKSAQTEQKKRGEYSAAQKKKKMDIDMILN